MPLEGNAAGFYININLTNTAISLLNVGAASKATPATTTADGEEMSSSKSWLGQSFSTSKAGAFSYELPRWQDPSAMLASVIPRPILQSTTHQARLPAPPVPIVDTRSAALLSPVTTTQSSQQDIEADLQFLLDAQADALMRGLNGEVVGDDRSSTGSRTPTARSYRDSSSSATRAASKKPLRKQQRVVGLRSARKGIYGGITALSEIKGEELEDLALQMDSSAAVLDRIADWETKREGLQDALAHAGSDADEETARAQRLRQEGDALQADINRVEMQLADMKARQRKVVDQLAAAENSVQAKLASYTASLRLLEEDVQKFLHIDPPPPGGGAANVVAAAAGSSGGGSGVSSSSASPSTLFRQTPIKRRTLNLARDHYREQREALRQRHDTTAREKAALDQGANLWRAAGEELLDFEKRMRAEMARMSSSSAPPPSVRHTNSAWEAGPTAADEEGGDDNSGPDAATARLRDLIEHMDALMTALNTKLQHARERGWNLVIVALGAELAALQQGRKILGDLVGEQQQQQPLPKGDELVDASADVMPQQRQQESAESPPPAPLVVVNDDDPIRALDGEFLRTTPRAQTPSDDHVSEDDDPDPDLLFSQHEPDSPEEDHRQGTDVYAQLRS